MNRSIVISGAILVVVAIILGAFGAHGLKDHVSEAKLISYETGVRYQIYHGLALLILGLNEDRLKFNLRWVIYFMIAGVILFSGSIYLLALEQLIGSYNFLGPITPIGGLLLIISWGLFIKKLLSR